ncbi:hypothetical protein ALC60_07471 [Trachymyrmex zeteki]|uniref:Uncharacterized protein n=1 Tax=Mycetomoellerius zeteki TaxID=64791 RepID=A0A151WZS6_9HYME|nr:hypothetical protein ALC60_07471 [Trachymyrmex zeteki]
MRAPWLVLILAVILDPLLLLGEAVCHRNDTNLSVAGQRSGETLSRRRRELTFPKGTAFVMTLTLLKAIQLNEPKNWNLDLEFDMIWPIPSQEDLKKVTTRRPSKLKRRHRRELYANLELALDRLNQLILIVINFSRNLPGRLCILRTICEAETVLSPPGFSIIEDAIRIILSQRNGKPVRSWTLMNSTMLHAHLTAIITVVEQPTGLFIPRLFPRTIPTSGLILPPIANAQPGVTSPNHEPGGLRQFAPRDRRQKDGITGVAHGLLLFQESRRTISQRIIPRFALRKVGIAMDYSAKYLIFLVLCLVLSEYEADDKYQNLSRKRRYVVFPEGSTFSDRIIMQFNILQIALCLTVHTLTPDDVFTEGLNWGISYDLPNESKPALEPFLELRNDKHKTSNKHDRYGSTMIANRYGALNSGWNNNVRQHFVPGKKKYSKSEYYYLQRRHRRELYNKLEVIMNLHIIYTFTEIFLFSFRMGFDGRTCILRALCEASQQLMPKGNTLIEEMMRISFSLPLKRVFSFEPEEHRTYTKAHKAGHEGKDCAAMFPGCSFSLIDLALGKYNAPPSDHSGDAVDHAGTFGTEVGPAVDWPRYNMRDTGVAFEIIVVKEVVQTSKREIGLPVETETLRPTLAGIFAVITPLGLHSFFGRLIRRKRGSTWMNTTRTHLAIRWVTGERKFTFSMAIVTTTDAVTITIVNSRYLPRSIHDNENSDTLTTNFTPSSLEAQFESNDLTFPSVTKFIKIAISEATMKVF